MSLRNRIRFVFGVLSCIALILLMLIVAGGNQRAAAVARLSAELEADLALVELESCMLDLQRQMAYLGESSMGAPDAPPNAEGQTNGGNTQSSGLDPSLKKSLGDATRDCSRRSEKLGKISKGLGEPLFVDVSELSVELLEDWTFVYEHIVSDYIEAVKRQAMSAAPRSDALFGTRFPGAKDRARTRVREARRTFLETSRLVDRGLLLLVALGFVVSALVLYSLVSRLNTGIAALTQGAIAFARGELGHRLELGEADEFGQVGSEMNRMAAELAYTTGLLKENAERLESNLRALEEAQADLVRNERMAALGRLVAGVAHEVNTPIGVAYTAGTFCRDQFFELREQQRAGEVSTHVLVESMEDGAEALELMIDNLSRASSLIQSFKQVAVDRGQAETRTIDLQEWLQSVIVSLSPLTKREGVRVEIRVENNQHLTLATGELEQVLTNLVVNAVTHAFPPDFREEMQEPCSVRLDVVLANAELYISITDNGRGMAEEEANQVFEPFYTTRRDAGGSGLGMHIVHQLVRERFEGAISLKTSPGAGAQWQLRIPVETDACRRATPTWGTSA